eukprot:6178622-Pleurochrysis_carterae.AAC.1
MSQRETEDCADDRPSHGRPMIDNRQCARLDLPWPTRTYRSATAAIKFPPKAPWGPYKAQRCSAARTRRQSHAVP